MIEAVAAMSDILSELQSLAGAASAPSGTQLAPPALGAESAAPPSFLQALHGALSRVDGAITEANASSKAFSSGDQNIALSDVMVSLEQANLALQMASGIRDKVVAAYTNIMNMPV